jgi:hypothetical protein
VLGGLLLALLAAGCGEGRAIFNVDLYSFLLADGSATQLYAAPPGVSDTVQDVTQVSLLGGLQDSGVDSLTFIGTLSFENAAGGPGTVGFEVFFDTSQTNLFMGSAPLSIVSAVGPGTTTTLVSDTVEVTSTLKDIFVQPSIYVGLRIIAANPQATLLQGQVRVTALDMRLIVQEQVF